MRNHGLDIQAAAASTSDVPEWARICLDHLIVDDGSALKECFTDEHIELYDRSKADHVRALHNKTGVPYSRMVFFDDEYEKNIVTIQRELPDVKTWCVPEGMTREAWEEAKAALGI